MIRVSTNIAKIAQILSKQIPLFDLKLTYTPMHRLSFYQNKKSMISNIQSSRHIQQLIQYYKIVQKQSIPRTLTVLSRKFAFYCLINQPNLLSQDAHDTVRKLYDRILTIQPVYLSPNQCYDLIYFIKVSQKQALFLDLNMDKIYQFTDTLIKRILDKIQYIGFNRICDIIDQIKSIQKTTNQKRTKELQFLFNNCQIQLKNVQSRQEQMDSAFHIQRLYKVLLQTDKQQRPANLYCQICKKLLIVIQFMHLKPLVRLVHDTISKFQDKCTNKQQELMTNKVICTMLKQICTLILGEPEVVCKDVSNYLKMYIQQLQEGSGDINQVLLNIALQTSRLNKLGLTPKQIEKQQRFKKQQIQRQLQYQQFEMQKALRVRKLKEMQQLAQLQAQELQQLQNQQKNQDKSPQPKASNLKQPLNKKKKAQINKIQRID